MSDYFPTISILSINLKKCVHIQSKKLWHKQTYQYLYKQPQTGNDACLSLVHMGYLYSGTLYDEKVNYRL